MELNTIFTNEGISLDSSLDFVNDGIIIVNKNMDILYINKSGRKICGIIPEGKYTRWPNEVGVYRTENRESLFEPDELPVVRALRGEILTDARIFLNNSILNNWHCISCNGGPIRKDDEIVGAILSFRDITEKLKQDQTLREEKAKINEASKLAALGFLAAEMGHEINNPLAIIRSSSWILRKILSGDEVDLKMALSKLDEIDLTIGRISEIITSVKNLSGSSEQEKMEYHVLGDIIQDVSNICGPRIQPKGMELKLNLKNPLLKEKLFCSRVQISEVFINLMVNAIDAIESSECPWVQIDVLKTDKNLIVRFDDCGDGVPPEIEEKIFTPFFSTKTLGRGTGLGLSISKKIMRRHGGDLILNRKVSNSCFDVIFPVTVR